jgi:4-hydroxy-tetrahydrodipicolinate reductase
VIRVAVAGATGRMGRLVARFARESRGVELAGATVRPGSELVGQDAGLATGGERFEVRLESDLAVVLKGLSPGAGVVVDFSAAAASVRHAELCADRGVALVMGTTGFSAPERAKVEAAATRIPLVLSANMSPSVAVMVELARAAAGALGDKFDVEIVEMHHRRKKDAPSGTALRLAEVIARATGRDPGRDVATARQGTIGERPAGQIGVQSLRGGDVVGEHTVLFVGDGERLEISHRATSREVFARGALQAAQWVVAQEPGLYGMAEVLGMKGSK